MRAALLVTTLIACGGTELPPETIELEPRMEPIVWLEMEDDPTDGVADSGVGFTVSCGDGQCPELTQGRIGNGYAFDGDDDHLRIAHDPMLDMTHGFTISMWFWLDQPAAGRALISRDLGEDPEDENTYAVLQSIYCSGREDRLYYATPGTLPLCGEAAFDVRGWAHFAATWDGTLKRFFVDGQVAANQGTTSVEFDEHDIVIGGNDYQGRLVSPFAGIIDDVRIYERPLEPSEVLRLPGDVGR